MTPDFPTKALIPYPNRSRPDAQNRQRRMDGHTQPSSPTWYVDEKGTGHTLEAMESAQIDRMLIGIKKDMQLGREYKFNPTTNLPETLNELYRSLSNYYSSWFKPAHQDSPTTNLPETLNKLYSSLSNYYSSWSKPANQDSLKVELSNFVQAPDLGVIWRWKPEEHDQLISLLRNQSDTEALNQLTDELKNDAIKLKRSYLGQPKIVQCITGSKFKIPANQKLTAETMTGSYVIPAAFSCNLTKEECFKTLEYSKPKSIKDLDALYLKTLLSKPEVSLNQIAPIHPYIKGATSIDLTTDRYLKCILKSSDVEQLWQSFPSQLPTKKQELAFLEKVTELVNRIFAPLKGARRLQRSQYNHKLVEEELCNLKAYTTRLGDLMSESKGMCLQRAALVKVLLDHEPNHALMTSFQGIANLRELQGEK